MLDNEIIADFVAESREHLEAVEPALLALEKNPDQSDLLDAIFRSMHSLKGASGFLNLRQINRLTHRTESVLERIRKGQVVNSPELMDLILEVTDRLHLMLDHLEKEGTEGDYLDDGLLEGLDRVLGQGNEVFLSEAAHGEQAGDPGDGSARQETVEESQDGGAYLLTLTGPDHLSDFLDEARETIVNLNAALLSLEKDPEQAAGLVQNIFRYFHNLKGNSGIIGFRELNRLTHEAESLLNIYRKKDELPNPETIDLLLEVVDKIESLLQTIDQDKGQVCPVAVDELIDRLVRTVGECGVSSDSAGSVDDSASGADDGRNVLTVDSEDVRVFEQVVDQQFNNIEQGLELLVQKGPDQEVRDGLFRSFQSLANACNYMELDEPKKYAQQVADLVDHARQGDVDAEKLVSLLRQETEILQELIFAALQALKTQDVQLESRVGGERGEQGQVAEKAPVSLSEAVATQESASGKAGTVPGAGREAKHKTQTSSSIRVDHERLDQLMNLIGELIINRNRFALLAKELEEGKDPVKVVQDLTETTDALARISDRLQDTIMQVRMVPLRTVFSRFPRLVRDLSRKSGKQIELLFAGEETELDKTVVEAIGDPLIHLVRNAADHGLELPEERMAQGKPEQGHIWMRAFHEGNFVFVEVEDDGRGMDPAVIGKKAVEKGLVLEEDLARLSEEEVLDFIFAPGFSTAREVTDVSGRGVGMDVVRNNIKALKGGISVRSVVGQGTRFTLSLPLTLAIIEALLVRVRSQTYAIPLDAVSETTKVNPEQIRYIGGRKVMTLRDDILGLANLSELLGGGNGLQDGHSLPLVVIESGSRKMGLVVDELLHRQEVVIKSLGEYLGELPLISGATIMGDGSVILILDPNEIFSLSTARV